MKTEIVIDASQMRAHIKDLVSRISDMKPAMIEIGVLVNNEIKENFIVGGRPTRWKPISEVTKRRRLRKNRKLLKRLDNLTEEESTRLNSPLRDTGILMGSIHQLSVTKDAVVVGTATQYGFIHNEGGHVAEKTYSHVKIKKHFRRPKNKKNHWVREHFRDITVPAHDIPKREYMNIPEGSYPLVIKGLEDHVNGKPN